MKITPSNELKHICRILESCENEGQIQTTERMFKNFVNKWKNKVDNVDLTEYIINFNLELEDKKNQICYLQ